MYSCLVNAELFQAGEREENRALARIYRTGKTRRRGAFRDWLMVVGLFALIAVVAAFLGGSEPLQGRARVVDGDSLEINGERRDHLLYALLNDDPTGIPADAD